MLKLQGVLALYVYLSILSIIKHKLLKINIVRLSRINETIKLPQHQSEALVIVKHINKLTKFQRRPIIGVSRTRQPDKKQHSSPHITRQLHFATGGSIPCPVQCVLVRTADFLREDPQANRRTVGWWKHALGAFRGRKRTVRHLSLWRDAAMRKSGGSLDTVWIACGDGSSKLPIVRVWKHYERSNVCSGANQRMVNLLSASCNSK